MTSAENLFIFTASTLFLILVIFVKNMPWKKLGFQSKHLFNGWWQVLLFNIVIFSLVQATLVTKFIVLPTWITDKDPLLSLLVIVFFQELLFRGVLISWLERWGNRKAIFLSTLIFVTFHLVAPYAWSVVGLSFALLTFVAGYFWAWHFLKFRNIYLLTISHLLVNLSFNYLLLN